MPPEIWYTGYVANFSSPTSRSLSSATARRCDRGTPRMRKPNSTLPTTSSHGMSACFWNTTPRSAPGPITRRPSRTISPADGSMKPAMHDRSVVLPQPDAPRATTKSPGSSARLMSESARVVRPDVPAYLTLTLRSSSLLKRDRPRDRTALKITATAANARVRRAGVRSTRIAVRPKKDRDVRDVPICCESLRAGRYFIASLTYWSVMTAE